MIKVTIFTPVPGGPSHYQGVTDVKTEGGVLSFDDHPDSTSFGYTKITTTCPFFVEEKIEREKF